MSSPGSRDVPIGETGLAVVRAVEGGPFLSDWNEVAGRDWPEGVEFRPVDVECNLRMESSIVSRRYIRKVLNAVDVSVGDAEDALHEGVPSIYQSYSLVRLNRLFITSTNEGARYVATRIGDARLREELRAIKQILSRATGRYIEWPRYDLELNLAYVPANVRDRDVRRIQGALGALTPMYVDFAKADIFPRLDNADQVE